MISKLVPAPLKLHLRRLHRKHALHQSVTVVQQRLVRSQPLPMALLEQMFYGWNNAGWAANTELLQALLDEGLEHKQSILECGTGLTTLLFAAVTQHSGGHLRSLEHNAQWHAHIRKELHSLHLPDTGVTLAPMQDHGDYHWYDSSGIPSSETYDLVLCDGPPGDTRGGRYGLMPQILSRLRAGARIIMDDTCRQQELHIIQRWLDAYAGRLTLTNQQETFAILTVL